MVNFTSALSCKRCKLEFSESLVAEAASINTDAVAYQYWPPRNVAAEKEPDWEAFSERLRDGLEEPDFEEPASHTLGTIVFGVCLVISQIALIYQFHQYLHLGENGEWRALTNTKSPVYVPVYEVLYWFELSVKALAFVTQIFLLWAFLAKYRWFLRLVSIYLIAELCFVLLDAWGVTVFEASIRQKRLGPNVEAALANIRGLMPIYFVSVLIIAIYFFYFIASKRVKKIFVY